MFQRGGSGAATRHTGPGRLRGWVAEERKGGEREREGRGGKKERTVAEQQL